MERQLQPLLPQCGAVGLIAEKGGAMHSIRIRILALTMAAILISVLTVGVISVVSIQRESDRSSAQEMRLLCDNCRSTIDDSLNSVEQSVDVIARYAMGELDSVALLEGGVVGVAGGSPAVLDRTAEQRTDFDLYLHEHLEQVEKLFLGVAEHTNGIASFYYRINPELSLREKGFFYSRKGSVSFSEEKPTAIGYYSPDDVSHVGWYYIPMERGRPSWLDPYFNGNLGFDVISYIAPVYKAGTFVGVIGMDVSQETLVSQVKDVQLFDTGFVMLVKGDGTVVYHPWIESGKLLPWDSGGLQDVKNAATGDSNEAPVRYKYRGENRQLCFTTLACGLKLIATAPVSEINAGGQALVSELVCMLVLILIVFFTVSTVVIRRVTDPLQRLTEASKFLAEGNYDVKLDYTRDDEVGTLTKAFQQLVDHLKVYISDLNSKAYQDAMTGVRNKGAYELSARKLNDAISLSSSGEETEFALVMFDCNDLKKINDSYGHEKGDVYLRRTCKLICNVFRHSPVFRLGGDEFAVILLEESYARREELLRSFDEEAEQVNAAASEPWEMVCAAKGMAAYDPAVDGSVESVLHRADKMMYEDKKRCKAEKTPQAI